MVRPVTADRFDYFPLTMNATQSIWHADASNKWGALAERVALFTVVPFLSVAFFETLKVACFFALDVGIFALKHAYRLIIPDFRCEIRAHHRYHHAHSTDSQTQGSTVLPNKTKLSELLEKVERLEKTPLKNEVVDLKSEVVHEKIPELEVKQQSDEIFLPELPKVISLDMLKQAMKGGIGNQYFIDQDLQKLYTKARQEINQVPSAIQKKDMSCQCDLYFALIERFHAVACIELIQEKWNETLRDQFLNAFASLQASFNPHAQEIQEAAGDFKGLTEQQRQQLYFFATEGRGGTETACLFSKVVPPFAFKWAVLNADPNYKSKMMSFALGQMEFRPGDSFPGIEIPPEAFSNGKTKITIPFESSLVLPKRAIKQKKLLEKIKADMQRISTVLAKKLNLEQPTDIIFRGPPGSGKTFLFAHMLKTSEEKVEKGFWSTDRIRRTLLKQGNGVLAQHEGAALMQQARKLDISYRVDTQTNVHKPDTKRICEMEPGRRKIIYDLYVTQEAESRYLKARADKGGSVMSDDQIAEALKNSAENRPSIPQTALNNPLMGWHLFVNNVDGEVPKEVASIINKQVWLDEEWYAGLAESDPLTYASLAALKSKIN